MLKIFQKPYNLFLPIAIALAITGFFNFSEPLELYFNNTYYVLRLAHLFLIPASLLALLWLIAYFTEKYTFSKALSWIHVILTSAAFVFLIATVYSASKEPAPATPNASKAYLQYLERESWSTAISIIVIVVAQLVFLVNLIVGALRRKDKSGE